MLLKIDIQPPKLFNSLHDLIRMAFPGYELREGRYRAEDDYLALTLSELGEQVLFSGYISIKGKVTEERESYPLSLDGFDLSPQMKSRARIFIFRLLCKHLDRNFNAYGILTGVRPVKIVHRLLDEGWDVDSIVAKLVKVYLLTPEKADLLIGVANANRPFLLSAAKAQKQVSIYIGIPFCPSRCYYCSFPGAVLRDYKRDISPFLEALLKEMNVIGDYIERSGLSVQTVYLGGGTPTVLNKTDLARIFDVLHCKYISGATVEVTVEAGRPDTLSLSKLELLKQAGVDRVCINPQTMNDDTLRLIGRNHDSRSVDQAVGWARSAGIKHINMDLIVGLPGENAGHLESTAARVLDLKPDNVTVHTLAVKRGSTMAETEGRSNILDRVAEVEQGVSFLAQIFTQHGYSPYYLYRQKYMQASMENLGYAQDDGFCIYNIQMIEERQTIIALGGGASSKFVNAADWSLTSFHNPKDPNSYIQTLDRLIARKVDKLRALN
ncbi:MAG: coproporphyrinogen dehydrogenase HemZ [Firmicutes bacterium HGW-Firmicutes-15]|nr:MAG: coproporphyrinogen dehydrogenase HemZ [Firmicutes bacterium HGW-Firmicutes-15]